MNRLLFSITFIMALCVNMQTIAQEGDSDRPAKKEYVYKTIEERKLKMHVDFPPGWKKTDTRPVIVFFFGGGWTNGSVESFSRQAEYFASRGLVCARADYRIKNKDGVTPDKCVEDARSAVRWMRKNSRQLGIDPDNLLTGAAKTSFFSRLNGSGSRESYTWVIQGRQGASFELKVRSQKGGSDSATITLR